MFVRNVLSFLSNVISISYKRGKILKDARTSSGTRTKEKMIELLDIAFSRKRDKDIILNVFKKNEWR